MTGSRPDNIEEYKIKAAILLKSLRSGDSQKALDAAARFQCLPHLSGLSSQEILFRKDGLRLKHALSVIAIEHGYASWNDLKHYLEKRDAIRDKRAYTPLYPRRCAGFLNEWYASYEVARSHLEQVGGYLLPYKQHFFLCKRDYIEVLGLDPDDEDWERIGWDWAKAADRDAWERLNSKLQSMEAGRVE